MVDEHTGENADKDANDGESKESSKTRIENSVNHVTIGCASEHKSQSGWKTKQKLCYFYFRDVKIFEHLITALNLFGKCITVYLSIIMDHSNVNVNFLMSKIKFIFITQVP